MTMNRLSFMAQASSIGVDAPTVNGKPKLKAGWLGWIKMTEWRKDYSGNDRNMAVSRNCGSLEEAIDDASWLVDGHDFNKGYFVGHNKGTNEYWIEFTGGISPADRILPNAGSLRHQAGLRQRA